MSAPHQQHMGRPARRLSLLATSVGAALALAPQPSQADHSGSAALYVWQDSNNTTVVSPRLTLRAPLDDETHANLSYAVDVWTSASVDIVASASQPVTEQRDELDVSLDHAIGDLTLAGAYRFSKEPDYEAHGGSVSASWDLAQKATTLALSLGGSADRVGRSGQGFFDRVSTATVGASLTQVVDEKTIVQLLYDLTLVRGYQASPYRFIALGGDGVCRGVAPLCVPERNPRQRTRQAGALRVRRALTEQVSLGAGYRGYIDDWGILSHTASADIAWAPEQYSVIALSYRFYTQNGADQYKSHYLQSDIGNRYFTRDKELSPLTSHRLGLEINWLWEVFDDGTGLATALEVGSTFFQYHDFWMLDRMTSFEVSLMTGMEFK